MKLGLGARGSPLLGSILAVPLSYIDELVQQACIKGVLARYFRCLSQESRGGERQQDY